MNDRFVSYGLWINSRIVEGRGIRSRLIADGRELFLTNVSGVKADIRLAVLRRRCVVAFGAIVLRKSIYIFLRSGACGDKVQRIKINAYTFSWVFFIRWFNDLSRAKEKIRLHITIMIYSHRFTRFILIAIKVLHVRIYYFTNWIIYGIIL